MLTYFTYRFDNEGRKVYPFRVGDIIRVTDLGYRYMSYSTAFKYFTSSIKNPHYCDHWYAKLDKEFKIFGMAWHEFSYDIVIYAKDRLGKDIVIDARGVKLVRQYPLRKGESIEVCLEKIQP